MHASALVHQNVPTLPLGGLEFMIQLAQSVHHQIIDEKLALSIMAKHLFPNDSTDFAVCTYSTCLECKLQIKNQAVHMSMVHVKVSEKLSLQAALDQYFGNRPLQDYVCLNPGCLHFKQDSPTEDVQETFTVKATSRQSLVHPPKLLLIHVSTPDKSSNQQEVGIIPPLNWKLRLVREYKITSLILRDKTEYYSIRPRFDENKYIMTRREGVTELKNVSDALQKEIALFVCEAS